ncbi:Uncharacterised protein [Campylobacter hyointestinalis subsp. hyointestinalis]|uniref:Uncharacterized protein n=2 Tax=Campylobacter hyointestinalis TaxID=198 RepID=A0A9W5AWU7_CAMHY|nr:hypothetical protein [Campylobacter hyointestinalis]CUU77432.1 Uncharacterised protein [Campylobacter hyointestinalis subsp. hyointestinalis]CUU92481.1 Uncharacterised protein [Campylobacter hyointestinalis subsp. hyointestinalis]
MTNKIIEIANSHEFLKQQEMYRIAFLAGAYEKMIFELVDKPTKLKINEIILSPKFKEKNKDAFVYLIGELGKIKMANSIQNEKIDEIESELFASVAKIEEKPLYSKKEYDSSKTSVAFGYGEKEGKEA